MTCARTLKTLKACTRPSTEPLLEGTRRDTEIEQVVAAMATFPGEDREQGGGPWAADSASFMPPGGGRGAVGGAEGNASAGLMAQELLAALMFSL